ncbi:MAG: D-glycero-beta-D-manno-heptose 1-phosphate adenylyltransferase [Streptosporangiales bacterium]|nr:D-glycero-beta-D-manno-heptose 1-phosphate adenylyltransferase [Streptosporangiales bacterium]
MSQGPLVVVGDSLLDVDLEGDSHRLSPDAPVPVVDCSRERPRPGGAGLAAMLAARNQQEVVLLTALCDDDAGTWVRRLLDGHVEVLTLPADGATPRKIRVRSDDQSIVRLDMGGGRAREAPLGERIRAVLRGAGTILVSDYGRGVADHPELRRAVQDSRAPVLWDPHRKGALPVHGARLVTPNEREAAALAGEPDGPDGLTAAARRAHHLVRGWRAAGVSVTLGELGALLSVGEDTPFLAPANRIPDARRVDSCGAGDCFAATAAAALRQGGLLREAVGTAVDAATQFVADGGPASLHRHVAHRDPGHRDGYAAGRVDSSGWGMVDAVRASGGTVVATGGCFDLLHAGHVGLLQRARSLGDCLVVCLNSDASVRRLKGPGRPIVPAADRARVLQALEPVDAVTVFDQDTPVHLLRRLRPDLWVKGGDYAGSDLPEAEVVGRLGGQVVLLPYLSGRSTSRLVSAAREIG